MFRCPWHCPVQTEPVRNGLKLAFVYELVAGLRHHRETFVLSGTI